MPMAYLELTPEFLTNVLQGFQAPADCPRYFRILENPLPQDTRCTGVTVLSMTNVLRLQLESRDFYDGETLPPIDLEAVKDLNN